MDFRPLTTCDLCLFNDWVQRPHVAEWWASPASLAEIEQDYADSIAGRGPLQAYVVLDDGLPIGFMQSYIAAAYHHDGWWLDEHDPGVRGIDQFLADPQQLGKGIGTAMVRAFVDRLFADPSVTRVQTDPSPDNARAIRCYEKAGFRAVGEVSTPDGTALLMYCDRPSVLVSSGGEMKPGR